MWFLAEQEMEITINYLRVKLTANPQVIVFAIHAQSLLSVRTMSIKKVPSFAI